MHIAHDDRKKQQDKQLRLCHFEPPSPSKAQTLGVSREKQGPQPSFPIYFCILAFFHLKYDILYA